MKFLSGLAVAAATLASSAVAAAAPDAAPVYLMRKSAAAAAAAVVPPSLPRQIVRHILLQRLNVDATSSFADSLPSDADADAALEIISQYGREYVPLFTPDYDTRMPAQLVVMLEGVSDKQAKQIADALPADYRAPSFTVADPPSKAANERFLVSELAHADIAVQRKSLQAAFDVFPRRWQDGLFVGLYDVSQSDVLDVLEKNMDTLVSLVDSRDLEVAIVVLPASSNSSKLAYWSNTAPSTKLSSPSELRKMRARHAEETVMIDVNEDFADSATADDSSFSSSSVEDATGSSAFAPTSHNWSAVARTAATIPSCFQSFNSCVAQTGNCSSHGVCVDKYAYNGRSSDDAEMEARQADALSCFVCHCYSTLNRPEEADRGPSTTKWAGNMCQKQDVSTPFWLLTGFSVTIVGMLSFAIGMLFNVGEEKLPGVIGAGVSRSK